MVVDVGPVVCKKGAFHAITAHTRNFPEVFIRIFNFHIKTKDVTFKYTHSFPFEIGILLYEKKTHPSTQTFS
jgi:hypothetical protein